MSSIDESPNTAMAANDSSTVSVMVAFYQSEPYIERCLRSLMDQTFTDFEAICVDDASTDNGLEIAKKITAGDPRFRFLVQPKNGGQGAARNRALDVARGKYVMCLDSDDYLVPEAIEKIVDRFESQNLDDLYFNADVFFESAQAYDALSEDYSHRDDFEDVATGPELFTFFENNRQFFPGVGLRATKRSLIEENHIRFNEDIIYEDLLFTLQILIASKRASFLNEPIYMRRVHLGSTTATVRHDIRNVEGHLTSVRYMREALKEHADEFDEEFVRAMAHRVHEYQVLCAKDWLDGVTEEEKKAYISSLSPEERVSFEMDVVAIADYIAEWRTSRVWRAGLVATAIPRAIRDKTARAIKARKAPKSEDGKKNK